MQLKNREMPAKSVSSVCKCDKLVVQSVQWALCGVQWAFPIGHKVGNKSDCD